MNIRVPLNLPTGFRYVVSCKHLLTAARPLLISCSQCRSTVMTAISVVYSASLTAPCRLALRCLLLRLCRQLVASPLLQSHEQVWFPPLGSRQVPRLRRTSPRRLRPTQQHRRLHNPVLPAPVATRTVQAVHMAWELACSSRSRGARIHVYMGLLSRMAHERRHQVIGLFTRLVALSNVNVVRTVRTSTVRMYRHAFERLYSGLRSSR